jgi:hypothetical protein
LYSTCIVVELLSPATPMRMGSVQELRQQVLGFRLRLEATLPLPSNMSAAGFDKWQISI